MDTATDKPAAATTPPFSPDSLHPSSPELQTKIGKKPSRVNLPGKTYAELITMAIESVPSRMMTIVEIQKYMRDNYPCFRTSYKGWHNSIRHNLSARECFYKVPIVDKSNKSRTHFWMINPDCSHCRDGNGLLQEAREWRSRRVMAKTNTKAMRKKKRRGANKNAPTTTRNADGLDSRHGVPHQSSYLPHSLITSRTDPTQPMDYSAPRSTVHYASSPSPALPHHRGSLDFSYPPNFLARSQPACLKCGDQLNGDCEYCVLLDVDENSKPPSMLRSDSTSSHFSTTGGTVENSSQRVTEFTTHVKEEEPSDQDSELTDDAVLDDIVDQRDLYPTDDNFDASVYDVEGHLHEAGYPSSITVPTSMPTSLPPSPAPSSPSDYPLDLSYQNTRRPTRFTVSPTLPEPFKHQPYPARMAYNNATPSLDYSRKIHQHTHRNQESSLTPRDRLVADPLCHVADVTKRFYRFVSDEEEDDDEEDEEDDDDVVFVSESQQRNVAVRVQDRTESRNGYLLRTEDERRTAKDHSSPLLSSGSKSQWTPPPSPYTVTHLPDTHSAAMRHPTQWTHPLPSHVI